MTDFPVNKTASFWDRVIAGANSIAAQVIVTMIIADFPFLAILKPLISYTVGAFVGYASRAEQLGVTFLVIDMQVGSQVHKAGSALDELKAAIISKDPVRIKAAKEAYDKAESDLDHSDGSATPH